MDENYFVERQSRQAVESKGNVFSDSVLCLGKIHEYPQSINSWKDKTEWFTQSPEYREMDRIDGEPVVFEGKNFPGHTTLQFIGEIQRTVEESLNSSKIDSSSYGCITTSIVENAGKKEICISNSSEVAAYEKRFPQGQGSDAEEMWCGTHTYKPNGLWNAAAEMMMFHLREVDIF